MTPTDQTPPVLAYIGLGANLGDAAATVLAAAQALQGDSGTAALRLSALYRTAPVDSPGPDYVNAVAEIRTTRTPFALLAALQAIEHLHGRERPYRNAPRTLDLDLLWYDGQHIQAPLLTVPHPRMHERAFVLQPLQELFPDLVLDQGPIAELLARCAGQAVERLAAARGGPAAGLHCAHE
jgi:2-amino-4-hydroxy-6-hydroxymethyldihydropteridine diphosphokinase